MLKSDKWIEDQSSWGSAKDYPDGALIYPYTSHLVRTDKDRKVISFGQSSYGYDIRLSGDDFRIFKRRPGNIVDPKQFSADDLESSKLIQSTEGDFFILPAHSYALGVAMERLNIPDNITVICIGKSTYARCGVIANLTPAEAGWRGHLTIEISNSSDSDVRIYAGEGICQLLFFEGEECSTTYEDRKGKYQDQKEEVTLARI